MADNLRQPARRLMELLSSSPLDAMGILVSGLFDAMSGVLAESHMKYTSTGCRLTGFARVARVVSASIVSSWYWLVNTGSKGEQVKSALAEIILNLALLITSQGWSKFSPATRN